MRFVVLAATVCVLTAELRAETARRPNILLAISDDQSYPHASAYGCRGLDTPAFDRVAREGVLFHAAFAPSPGCSPTRAALLTGRYPWQNEHAGTHASSFSNRFPVYPALLEAAGYHVGFTGKGWGPGNFTVGGFSRNPAGPAFQHPAPDVPPGVRGTDYAAAFDAFLSARDAGQPFCFWFGCSEPHRGYHPGIGAQHGGDPSLVEVPGFLPDDPVVRQDLLDYFFEIEWFDQHLGRMLAALERIGELDNTLVVVTSDNGMPFPRAKANCYEYGVHVPLAVRWGGIPHPGRTVDDVVNLIDLMPTFLQVAGVSLPADATISGQSIVEILASSRSGQVTTQRTATFVGRERHSSSRYQNRGYPQRAIRTARYLYLRNFRSDRWPAGAPRKFGTGNYPADTSELGPPHAGYHDIDHCPTLDLLIARAEVAELSQFLAWAVAKRPAEELYDVQDDPACLHNLATERPQVRQQLSDRLDRQLRITRDPRIVDADGGEVFESYRRYSRLRTFPE